jgi:hypothetical protein
MRSEIAKKLMSDMPEDIKEAGRLYAEIIVKAEELDKFIDKYNNLKTKQK